MQQLQTIREQIEQTKTDIERAERQYDLNRAAELKYGTLPGLEASLKAAEQAADRNKESAAREGRSEPEEIAAVVSRWTGVPVKQAA
ncbi:MAG: hypothetical protein U0791_25700 [Gemmataceae bacterium]